MIVVAGEALIDLVSDPDGRYRPLPGGSPMNVAIGLVRLGTPSTLLARFGSGGFGHIVRSHVEANGVDLNYAVTSDEPTTLAVVSLDEAGVASYDFYVNGTADWGWTDDELPDPLPAGTQAFVSGSLSVMLEPGASAIRRLVTREHARGAVTIVIDPNVRPALLGDRSEARVRVESLIAQTDVVKVSDEDLEWLCPGESIEGVAAGWIELGPALVVVTKGGEGAYGVTASGVTASVPGRPTDLVDTVGAGDTFTATLVDGLGRHGLLGPGSNAAIADLSQELLTSLLDRAGIAAAINCSRKGANPPTLDELNAVFTG